MPKTMPPRGGAPRASASGAGEPEQPPEERRPEQQRHAGDRRRRRAATSAPPACPGRADFEAPRSGEAGHRGAGADGEHLQDDRRAGGRPRRRSPARLRHQRHARPPPRPCRGRYLPRLDTVQMRAAVQPSSRWPQPASMRRQATMRSAYIEPDDERAQHDPARLELPLERLRAELGPSCGPGCAAGEPDDRERRRSTAPPRIHGATHPAPRDTSPRRSRRRARARAGPATIRPPAGRAPGGRDRAAGRGSRRSSPRATGA